MGPIEEATRQEIPEGTALAEIAFALAESLDLKEGGASAARELRAILTAAKERNWGVDGFSNPDRRLEYRKNLKRQGKWVQMLEGEWEWSDDADDWIKVSD